MKYFISVLTLKSDASCRDSVPEDGRDLYGERMDTEKKIELFLRNRGKRADVPPIGKQLPL